MHLGRRESIDFDFFGFTHFDPDVLLRSVPLLESAMPVQKAANTLTCLVGREDEPVDISFFGVPELGRIADPLVVKENGIRVASLLDLAGMTAAVVQKRAEAKDYVDVDALIQAGISLPDCLAAGRLIYRGQFNAQITLKALSYFGDPGLAALPDPVKARLKRAVAAVDLGKLPPKPLRRLPKPRPGGREDR